MISKGEYIKAEFSQPILAQFVRVTVTKVTRDVELEMIVIGCKRRRGVAVESEYKMTLNVIGLFRSFCSV